MTIARLSIITENQKSKEKAEVLASLLGLTLNISTRPKLEKYYKFENSYKIEFEFSVENEENLFHYLIELTDRICSPWSIYYQREESLIEMIFNKNKTSRFRQNEFNVINWCHLQIDQ